MTNQTDSTTLRETKKGEETANQCCGSPTNSSWQHEHHRLVTQEDAPPLLLGIHRDQHKPQQKEQGIPHSQSRLTQHTQLIGQANTTERIRNGKGQRTDGSITPPGHHEHWHHNHTQEREGREGNRRKEREGEGSQVLHHGYRPGSMHHVCAAVCCPAPTLLCEPAVFTLNKNRCWDLTEFGKLVQNELRGGN